VFRSRSCSLGVKELLLPPILTCDDSVWHCVNEVLSRAESEKVIQGKAQEVIENELLRGVKCVHDRERL
jgi:hypothetical protein